MTDASILFRDALQGVFGKLDWLPAADGSIHRFHVQGDRTGSLNGWYLLFADGIASGCFGSWKAGEVHHWSNRGEVTALEAEQMRQRIEQARRQREAEQRQRQQQASEYAGWRWDSARRADPTHSYLQAKQVRSYGLRQHRDELLVPLYLDGVLVNLQRIDAGGGKRFLRGGRITGCYSPLGNFTPGRRLYVCEGWATGASIHESSGSPVACAMNAGNLKPVALALRAKYGDLMELVIAGDDDRQTPGNPGRTSATAAALAVGAMVTFPDWPDAAPIHLTDFNDLANWSAAHE
ncbi:putative DNA primase/helicase [Pseudomonas delhiensis]|uniref:DNA primase/helicase n=1 Tax=Pseudomonas delhiensis TaxID=366289 RepID=A0A239NDV3_9PSED|nr:toprim domain-containing protein [Pseudomonas delhiensis]SDK67955.1 putative DNA primase/helicase [Pseudomonas delhiensis]SNT52604.1 putative DNA primase/helicase [Pseudomonas delhiensis]